MAKGKRLSDPEALCTIEAKLQSGQGLCETDRPTLNRLARLDLIRLIEGHYGEALTTSTKNSVQRLVQHVLGPEIAQGTSQLVAAASSLAGAEGARVVGAGAATPTALRLHGLTVERLEALSRAELPGLPELLRLPAPHQLSMLLAALGAAAPPALTAAAAPAAAAAAATAAPAAALAPGGPLPATAAAPAVAEPQAPACHHSEHMQAMALWPLLPVQQQEGVLQLIKEEDFFMHVPFVQKPEPVQQVLLHSLQQVQVHEHWHGQQQHQLVQEQRGTSHAAGHTAQGLGFQDARVVALPHADAHLGTAMPAAGGSAFDHQLPACIEREPCFGQLHSGPTVYTSGSIASDALTHVSTLDDESVQLQEHHHHQQHPHQQQQQLRHHEHRHQDPQHLCHDQHRQHMPAGNGSCGGVPGASHMVFEDASWLPGGSSSDLSSFCFEQLLADTEVQELSSTHINSNAMCAPSHLLPPPASVVAAMGGMMPAAAPWSTLSTALGTEALAASASAGRKRPREDTSIHNDRSYQGGAFDGGHMAPGLCMSSSRNDSSSSSSSNMCLGCYDMLCAAGACDADAGLAGALDEALEALFGTFDAGSM